MGVLNIYYPEVKEFMGEAKIISPSKYSEMARLFSHQLWKEIKESYEAFHDGSLQGITFTLDNRHYIKTILEAKLDKMPVLLRSRL